MSNLTTTAAALVSSFAIATQMAGIAPAEACVSENRGRGARRIASNWKGELQWDVWQDTGWAGLISIQVDECALEKQYQEGGMEQALAWLNSFL